jgi:hypothetical protein
MTERGAALSEYSFQWPALDAVFMVQVMRVAMFALILAASVWLMSGMFSRLTRSPDDESAPVEK